MDQAQQRLGPVHGCEEGEEIQRRPQGKITWQVCLVNAEDHLIKAEQDPLHRESHLAAAAYWKILALKVPD